MNAEVAMDLVWLESNPVLHVIDTYTCYQNAAFIKYTTASGIWRLFVELWASVYCGYPDVIRVDRDPSFMVAAFHQSSVGCVFFTQASGIEAHNP